MAQPEVDSTMKLNNYWQKFRPKDGKPVYQYKETLEVGQKLFVVTLIFLGFSEEAQASVKKDAARLAATKMLDHFPADLIAATMSKQSPEKHAAAKASSSSSSCSVNGKPKASTNGPTTLSTSSLSSKPKLSTFVPPNVQTPSFTRSSSTKFEEPKPSTSSSSSSASTPDDDLPSLRELAINDADRAERKIKLEKLLDELLPQRRRDYAEYVQKFLTERDPYYDNLHANMQHNNSPQSALLRRILDENIDVNRISNIVPTFEQIMKQMKTTFYCKFIDSRQSTTYICVIRVVHHTLTFMEVGDTPRDALQQACRTAIKNLVLFLRDLN